MKYHTFRSVFLLLTLATFVAMTGCESDNPDAMGELQVSVTDAPVDDTNVEGVFVTVTEVKVNGKAATGFSGKQTIDLLAYQNGNTQLLSMGDVEAKSYSEITLVLDLETDANGDSPGCYVKTLDGTRHDLATSTASTLEVSAKGLIEVMENTRTDAVIDFDLRKSIAYAGSGNAYTFASDSELGSALRLVAAGKTGSIKGTYTGSTVGAEKVVVYAYKKGEFNKETEMQAQGSSGIQFKNAVSSALVSGNAYTLAFLEPGEYEVCFATYEDANQDGKMEFAGFLQGSLMLTGSVTSLVSVEAGLQATLVLQIIGIIG